MSSTHETLKRDRLQPARYEYLSLEESALYDRALARAIPQEDACAEIVRLLEHAADSSRSEHARSTY
jgi:hypothetical protein